MENNFGRWERKWAGGGGGRQQKYGIFLPTQPAPGGCGGGQGLSRVGITQSSLEPRVLATRELHIKAGSQGIHPRS